MIQIKNAKELDGMRRANALSAAALKYGGEHIEAGMTTWELDKLIYEFIIKHGGTPNFKGLYGFPGTACISLNDTVIHGIPPTTSSSARATRQHRHRRQGGRLQRGQRLHLPVGKIDLEAQRLLDVTKEALHLGIARPRPATGSGTSARPSRLTARRRASRWCGNLWATAPAVNCTKTPRCPTLATPAAAPAWCPA